MTLTCTGTPPPPAQIGDLESMCTSQHSKLEEADERYRTLADAHDALRHSALNAKAQLVTAQAQVRGQAQRL